MKRSMLVSTTGVKGGKPKASKQGRVHIETLDENVIIVDSYKGQGDTYQERNEEEIIIIFSDETQWKGTFKQLNEQLSRK
ncbi:MAG TPA: hypothetical protein PLC61_07240 [Chitinophagales bacterium]|nr:hypothetical protein [Chitinophagales bacterium]HND46169.1 hypothetical protein [Chitinophagales bacterium]